MHAFCRGAWRWATEAYCGGMKTLSKALLAAGLFVGLAASAPAAVGETLKIGDPAPALSVGEWVKGDAHSEMKKGEIYLIEFWATW